MSEGQEFVLTLIVALAAVCTAIALLDSWLSHDEDEDIRNEIQS